MEIQGKDIKTDPAEIEENKKKVLERFSLYKKHGYDRIKSQKFIIKKTGIIKGRILEIGTGKGYLTSLLSKKAKNIVTVDISKEDQKLAALNIASEGDLERVAFLTCDATKLPYPDNCFDLVISENAFHHFEHPFVVLKEMIRVCGKKLVISDFNTEGFEIVRRVHQDEGRIHDEWHGDFNIVPQYLKENGFSVKKYEGFCQVVFLAEKRIINENRIETNRYNSYTV